MVGHVVVLVLQPVLTEARQLRVRVPALPDPLPVLGALLVVEERNEVFNCQS